MTAFDYVVIAVLGGSVVLGLWRGVVSEVLALLAWVVAFFAARQFGQDAGVLFARWIGDGSLRVAAGMVAVGLGVLLGFGIARLVLSLVLRAVGLGLVDRFLGGAFGVFRGLLIVFAGVLAGGMTQLPKQGWWREARLAPPLETAVIAARPWLPPDVAKRIRYR